MDDAKELKAFEAWFRDTYKREQSETESSFVCPQWLAWLARAELDKMPLMVDLPESTPPASG